VSLPNAVATDSTKTVATKAATQLLGLWDSNRKFAPAVYFAAHDPTGATKHCSARATKTSAVLGCTMLATNASLPLRSYSALFPIAVTVLPQGADWWDIASMYRAWVLPNSLWSRQGPLDSPTRAAAGSPDWLENVTLWVNNNHGSDPLSSPNNPAKPLFGGDPAHVQTRMLQLNALLALPEHDAGHVALHWCKSTSDLSSFVYIMTIVSEGLVAIPGEWDTLGYALGSNYTSCDRHPAPCGFDSHYPDYFPARVGCKGAIAAMQASGTYISGQQARQH
jgi:hypothetical protein